MKQPWIQHIAFWLVSYYFLLRYFAYENEIFKSDLIYTGLFHLSLIVVVYINIRVLIPYFLRNNRLVLYFLLSVVLCGVGIFLNEFTFNYLTDFLFQGYFFISYYEWSDLAIFMAVYWTLSTLLKLSKAWFAIIETQQKLHQLAAEKLQAELDGLKSQVNPHFLFNALNGIYSLALDKAPQTPTAILKLADVLRYMLYESNEPTVPLDREIQSLKDYIEVQKIRLEDESVIEFIIKGNTQKARIAPLLLLPLVENGFKHGLKGDVQQQFLRLELEVNDQQIIFKCQNNKGEANELEKSSGIGLKNVKRRLELIYPNNYTFEIEEEGEGFKVLLSING